MFPDPGSEYSTGGGRKRRWAESTVSVFIINFGLSFSLWFLDLRFLSKTFDVVEKAVAALVVCKVGDASIPVAPRKLMVHRIILNKTADVAIETTSTGIGMILWCYNVQKMHATIS